MNIGGNLPGRLGDRHDDRRRHRREQQPRHSIPLRAEFTKVADTRRPGQLDGARCSTAANNVDRGTDRREVRPHRRAHDAATSRSPRRSSTRSPGTTGTWAAGGITLDFGTATDADRLTGAAALNSVAALSQDGSAVGSLVELQRRPAGSDQRRVLERPHPGARADRAGDLRRTRPVCTSRAARCSPTSANSGAAQIGVAGQGGRGTLSGGTLERSNVDLAAEFTNMIIAQRGFEANAKVITTSDELLQDLVNLKR